MTYATVIGDDGSTRGAPLPGGFGRSRGWRRLAREEVEHAEPDAPDADVPAGAHAAASDRRSVARVALRGHVRAEALRRDT
jgi:hypothetical protein